MPAGRRDPTVTPELVRSRTTGQMTCALWYRHDKDKDMHFCKICSAWASDANHITGKKHKQALKSWGWPKEYMPDAECGTAVVNPDYKFWVKDDTSPEDNGAPAAWPAAQQPTAAPSQPPQQPAATAAPHGAAGSGLGAPPGIPLDGDDEPESITAALALVGDAVGEIARRQEETDQRFTTVGDVVGAIARRQQEADQRSFGQYEQLFALVGTLSEKIAGHAALQESLREITQLVSMSEVQEVEKIVETQLSKHMETVASNLNRQSHRFERSQDTALEPVRASVAEVKADLQKVAKAVESLPSLEAAVVDLKLQRGHDSAEGHAQAGEVKRLLNDIIGKVKKQGEEAETVSTALADLRRGIDEVAEMKAHLRTLTERMSEDTGAKEASIQRLQSDVDNMMTAIGELKAEAARQASQEDGDWTKYSARAR